MDLDALVNLAATNGASDLHLEAGLPAAIRIRGTLRTTGDPVAPNALLEMARRVTGEEEWPRFLEQRSFDCSRNFHGVRCRINILQTARGVGFAIRLLSSFTATIEKLNLHPDLKKLVTASNGLILVSGATGSGKSSTLAALIEEINLTETRHIVTIESPIEYTFRPRCAPPGHGHRPFLDLRRGAAAGSLRLPGRNPKQRRRPARGLHVGRHLPAAALPARTEYPRAGM
ncbi:MAG: ATPase, T2SS/T4P/T4SS family [Verrucomicrobia bacterium]|nr:ATPase, T2SS/T4P/T4SS family [Verrucomicrobiota bacterium]